MQPALPTFAWMAQLASLPLVWSFMCIFFFELCSKIRNAIFSLVKQAGKDASYLGVLVIGFGITGVISWFFS